MSFNLDLSDHFERALSNLIDKLEGEDKGLLGVRKLFRSTIQDFPRIQGLDKGLLQAAGRLLLGTGIEDSPWIQDLGLLFKELWYWECLRKVLIFIQKCSSNADKIVPNWGSLMNKLEAAFSEIAKDISRVCQYKKIAKKPFETLRVFRDSEKKIMPLRPEIGEALDQLSSSCRFSSLEWHLPVLACSLPSELLPYISKILELIGQKSEGDQVLDGDLNKGIEDFKSHFISPLLSFVEAAPLDVGSGNPSDNIMIHNSSSSFFAHIAFVAVRVAKQSLHYWNNYTDPVVARSKITGLLDLRHEIDPLTHQFLEFALQYLRAVNVTSPGQAEHLASSFLNHILTPGEYRYDDSEWKLMPLVIFVINEWEEPHSEDVQSLLAEIKAVLMMAGCYCRGLQFLDRSPFELPKRICLLNAEVFLKQQLNSSSISLESKVVEGLISGLGSSSHQQEGEPESGRQTFTSIDQVAAELACLRRSSCIQEVTEHNLRISLFKLLLNIVFLKAKSTCKKFFRGNTYMLGTKNEKIETPVEGLNFVTSQQEQIRTFLEGLKVFNAFVANQQEKLIEGIEPIFTRIEAIARGITYLCCSFPVFNITEEITKKWATSYSDFLDKLILIKAELRGSFSQPARSNFPKIHGIGFMDSLLQNLLELIKLEPDSIALVKHLIERIRSDLEFLSPLLMKQDTEHLEHSDLCRRVKHAAYEVEYIIDTIEAGIGDHWQHLLELYDILEEIRLIKVQATKTNEEKTNDARAPTVAQSTGKMVLRITPEIGEPIVCLSDEEEVIINRLTRGSSQRDVISIVGMPGIGKTTLAKKVYNDPKVTFHFHVRTWCTVSQVYEKRELILDILSNICGLTEDIHQMTNEDLELKLYQNLKQQRYLIVMDDVWDNEALTSLEGSFPNDGNGSRILLTSCLRDVALKAKPDSDPHSLRLLSDDESWKLLQTKIFQDGCPDELMGAGKEIAKTCKGLPLAVVAIAGVLERTGMKQDKWKEIAETLSSRIIDDPQTQCKDILQLSYNSLPDYLKACFLYFGVFLEDKAIPVSKLVRLWIAEGFIQETKLKSLEDLAEDYLIDLIGRSLVTVSRIGSRGKVKACRIHDLLRDLCLSKAKEVQFLQQITGNDEPYASLSAVDFGDGFYDYSPPDPVTYETHRVCICLKRKHFIMSSPWGPCSRSLIFFAASDRYPRRPYDISFIPRHFKLLKVLDLETINMGLSFPTGIECLVQLRYLALSGDIENVPPSIANLRKLETLILKGLKGKVILPDSLWSMARLRHIHVDDFVDFILGDDELESSLQLDNLVSISSPILSYGKEAEKTLKRFPNLRKLRCIFLESWDPSRNYNRFPELHCLLKLESLKIFYVGRVRNPGEFTLPWNLKKLTLSDFQLPWIHISAVGRLENLEVLKLLSRAFEGKRWDMRKGEFVKLKYLELDTLNVAQWNATKDHLLNLQHLVLRNCKDLEEVPFDFGEIPTLQMIEVQSCRRSTEESVKIIGDEVEGIKIIINHKIHI